MPNSLDLPPAPEPAPRSRRAGYTLHLSDAEGTHYLPPPNRGQGGFDRRADALDKAATSFLKSRKVRPHTPPNDREARRQYRAEGRPVLKPGKTLQRAGGMLRPGARL